MTGAHEITNEEIQHLKDTVDKYGQAAHAIDLEDCEDLRALALLGLNGRELSDEFGVSEEAIRSHIRGECRHETNRFPDLEWDHSRNWYIPNR